MEQSLLSSDVNYSLFGTENDSYSSSGDVIDPIKLEFIPRSFWINSKPQSLQSLKDSYFSKKNSVNRRFEHKLWNALKITSAEPHLYNLVGVSWVNDTVLKVQKLTFAKFLHIATIDGGLFHKQGNFTCHGFQTLSEKEAKDILGDVELSGVDYKNTHLVRHINRQFTRSSDEQSLLECKWDNPSEQGRVAKLKMDVGLVF